MALNSGSCRVSVLDVIKKKLAIYAAICSSKGHQTIAKILTCKDSDHSKEPSEGTNRRDVRLSTRAFTDSARVGTTFSQTLSFF